MNSEYQTPAPHPDPHILIIVSDFSLSIPNPLENHKCGEKGNKDNIEVKGAYENVVFLLHWGTTLREAPRGSMFPCSLKMHWSPQIPEKTESNLSCITNP